MKKVRFSELSDAIRSFLAGIEPGETLVVEDDQGRLQYGITPCVEATPEERAAAWERIEKFQQLVGNSTARRNQSEEDLDRVLQEDE